MALLRTNLMTFNQRLESLDSAIEEQNYIVEGLRLKATNQIEIDDHLYRKYHDKYEQLYFDEENNLDNWKNYKGYLQELLKKTKIQPFLAPNRPATINYGREHKFYQDNQRYAKSNYNHRNNPRTEQSLI